MIKLENVMDLSKTQMEGQEQGFWANCKRAKVNAIRQFPKGCGPYALHLDSHWITKDTTNPSNFAASERDSSPTVLRSVQNLPEKYPPKILEPYNCCFNRVDENRQEQGLENVMDLSKTQMERQEQGFWANCKRAKVNAIRQFPKGCGPYALHLDSHWITKDTTNPSNFAASERDSSPTVLRSVQNLPEKYPPKILEPYNCCFNRVDENRQVIRSLHSNLVHADKNLVSYQKNEIKPREKSHHQKKVKLYGMTDDGEHGEVLRPHSNIVHTDKNFVSYQKNDIKHREKSPEKYHPKRAKLYGMTDDDEHGEVLRSHSKVVHADKNLASYQKNEIKLREKSYHQKRVKLYGMTDDEHGEEVLSSHSNVAHTDKRVENGVILRSSSKTGREFVVNQRENVIRVMKMFEKLFSYLMVLRKKELESRKRGGKASIYIEAAMLLKKQDKWINTGKQIGFIHGVEIGDKFLSRAELNVIGIHQQFWAGIDYMKKDGKLIATSIVASGRYFDTVGSSDTLIYSGHGGNPTIGKGEVRDQRLERGNLALKNSRERKSVVRVIKGVQVLRNSRGEKMDESTCNFRYVYDGLYFVDDCKIERGNFGKLVFKFLLNRVFDQPKLSC